VGGVRVARRAATRHYTYGYGRVEDRAGLFIVTMIVVGGAGVA
jgi:divalent metal cation (Fe/Co/Zn/Cd) transporter